MEFSDALKTALESVNDSQVKAADMGKKFAMGDDSVSLSDMMIAMQKSSINFQAAIQVRNKLLSSYHEILNIAQRIDAVTADDVKTAAQRFLDRRMTASISMPSGNRFRPFSGLATCWLPSR